MAAMSIGAAVKCSPAGRVVTGGDTGVGAGAGAAVDVGAVGVAGASLDVPHATHNVDTTTAKLIRTGGILSGSSAVR